MGRHKHLQPGERGLSADQSVQADPSTEYLGAPDHCDCCGRPLEDEHFFADALLPAHQNAAGFLCWTCTQVEGIRPGWGRGQFYRRVVDEMKPASEKTGRWLCVAGGPPCGEIDNDAKSEVGK